MTFNIFINTFKVDVKSCIMNVSIYEYLELIQEYFNNVNFILFQLYVLKTIN